MEETGLSACNVEHIHTTNDIYACSNSNSDETRHNATVLIAATWSNKDYRPVYLEPHKVRFFHAREYILDFSFFWVLIIYDILIIL